MVLFPSICKVFSFQNIPKQYYVQLGESIVLLIHIKES